jgi:small subunit ribosomal protein S20
VVTKKAPKKSTSAMKRARQSEKRRLRNQAVKTYLKTVTKKVEAALSQGRSDDVKEALRKAIPAFDKAASKGVIHKGKASRKISRLTRKVNAAVNTSASEAEVSIG